MKVELEFEIVEIPCDVVRAWGRMIPEICESARVRFVGFGSKDIGTNFSLRIEAFERDREWRGADPTKMDVTFSSRPRCVFSRKA